MLNVPRPVGRGFQHDKKERGLSGRTICVEVILKFDCFAGIYWIPNVPAPVGAGLWNDRVSPWFEMLNVPRPVGRGLQHDKKERGFTGRTICFEIVLRITPTLTLPRHRGRE